jgi:hypothetical protein
MRRWKAKASYTVEAAVLVPLLIGVMVLAMRIGILLCGEVKETNEAKAMEEMWEVEDFYRYQVIKEVADD